MGRDVFTRTWYGARISLFVGVMAALIDFFIGIIYGGISGYKGGRTDTLMMRIIEILVRIAAFACCHLTDGCHGAKFDDNYHCTDHHGLGRNGPDCKGTSSSN